MSTRFVGVSCFDCGGSVRRRRQDDGPDGAIPSNLAGESQPFDRRGTLILPDGLQDIAPSRSAVLASVLPQTPFMVVVRAITRFDVATAGTSAVMAKAEPSLTAEDQASIRQYKAELDHKIPLEERDLCRRRCVTAQGRALQGVTGTASLSTSLHASCGWGGVARVGMSGVEYARVWFQAGPVFTIQRGF